ncbi:preprotein translocase subunit SecA [Desnuesiella massiliensis]|uniref:preprotein translocase subunit SecA n=1 Tax=Desnuesiella massiliensis TaxID=1650662 RepID=UPI0006E21C30|nr:preprotein translocase subunit SecA [Desnuesiella massiliensis]
MDMLKKLFGDYNTREIKKLSATAEQILSLETSMEKLSDEELKNKTEYFKERLSKGETLNDILVEAFAVVREAAGRTLNMKHYKEQLMGGIVLHQGRIAEMKTGEGKTLVATLPTYLNALEGKGVHVVTVNDYLANRDKEEMGQVYGFLGLTTGVILHDLKPDQRKQEYNCDITYGTNSEFGFDYLRDNMVMAKEEKVQRPLHFAVVDEADSIFIDEARTPLIISGQGAKASELYRVADFFVKTLKKDEDYEVDEKTKAVMLTEQGVEKAEDFYKVEDFTITDNFSIQHHTVQALKANYAMRNGVDYIIRDGEVLIVDTFTGRVMDGRRFSDGLHEAIEAKEGVKIKEESQTLATITYQHYFKLYKKLSGMSGTAKTEENEFREVYNLDVVVIPTHKPIRRVDSEDKIYKTELGKFKAIVEEIIETHKIGQPVLVGTASIEKSELLSFMLKKRGIPHQVLNAKHHKREAEIVAHAGEVGMVTIATNMAGRGTDIKLGEGTIELGGLKVIGTEKHEARRIDNQLRGRSGRQGDVGVSQFYISLEDEIIIKYLADREENPFDKIKIETEGPIEIKKVKDIVEAAQKIVESDNFGTRKNLIKYDDTMNKQREVIYAERDKTVETEDIKEYIRSMINQVANKEVDERYKEDKKLKSQSIEDIADYFNSLVHFKDKLIKDELLALGLKDIKEYIANKVLTIYERKEKLYKENIRSIEKAILLKVVDQKWINHLQNMEHLKQYIGLHAYKQKDPVEDYNLRAGIMFDDMIYNIKLDTVKFLLNLREEKEE